MNGWWRCNVLVHNVWIMKLQHGVKSVPIFWMGHYTSVSIQMHLLPLYFHLIRKERLQREQIRRDNIRTMIDNNKQLISVSHSSIKSVNPSLSPCIHPSLPASIPLSLHPSFSPCIRPSLPPCIPLSLPASVPLPASVFPSLHPSLPLHASVPSVDLLGTEIHYKQESIYHWYAATVSQVNPLTVYNRPL